MLLLLQKKGPRIGKFLRPRESPRGHGVVLRARRITSSRDGRGEESNNKVRVDGEKPEDRDRRSRSSSSSSTSRSRVDDDGDDFSSAVFLAERCGDASERKKRESRMRFLSALGVAGLGVCGMAVDEAKAVALETSSHLSSAASSSGGVHVGHLMNQFVVLVESSAAHSGPFGLLILGSVIATSELLPLVPTQPLALVSGLLFGASKGALVTLVGTTTAASVAFTISSGPLGEKMRTLVEKMEGGGGEETTKGNGMSDDSENLLKKLAGEVEDLNPLKQMMSVVLLRLSPVVPFSISNYMLGLTPIQFIPFSVGTFLGMSPWCLLYATLGKTAGTILLKNSADGLLTIDGMDDLGKLVQQQLSNYSELLELLAVATPFMLGLLVFNTIGRRNQQNVANLDEESPK